MTKKEKELINELEKIISGISKEANTNRYAAGYLQCIDDVQRFIELNSDEKSNGFDPVDEPQDNYRNHEFKNHIDNRFLTVK